MPFGRGYSGEFSNFHQRMQKVTSKPKEYLKVKFEGKVQPASFGKGSELEGEKA